MHKSFPHGIHGSKDLLLGKFQLYILDLIQQLLSFVYALILFNYLWEWLRGGGSSSYCFYSPSVEAWEASLGIETFLIELFFDIGLSIPNCLIYSCLVHGILHFPWFLNHWHILECPHGLHFTVYLCFESGSICCPVQHVSFQIVVLSLHLLFVVVFHSLQVINWRTLKGLVFLFL